MRQYYASSTTHLITTTYDNPTTIPSLRLQDEDITIKVNITNANTYDTFQISQFYRYQRITLYPTHMTELPATIPLRSHSPPLAFPHQFHYYTKTIPVVVSPSFQNKKTFWNAQWLQGNATPTKTIPQPISLLQRHVAPPPPLPQTQKPIYSDTPKGQ